MVNKKYCMSSYLAFRYIEREDVDFFPQIHHTNFKPTNNKVYVYTSDDIDREIARQIKRFEDKKKGLLLSGGMDSGILASYLSGADAYTFRFLNGEFQKEELNRAEYFADYYGLQLHYVDISWDITISKLNEIMTAKAAPVHSIEPQIFQAALQAKGDGVEVMFIGESSDLIFGGMDKLLAKDWEVEEFAERYIFTDPSDVLEEADSMSYLFERYRINDGKIDFLRFMDEVFSIESSGSYYNAFKVAGMEYYDPYACLKMGETLDLYRIRHGESKYLIRDLMKKKYPDIPVPEKIPMPRPVDMYFENWNGPMRLEFKTNIDMNNFSGDQKWQIFCLEQFLNLYEPVDIEASQGVSR